MKSGIEQSKILAIAKKFADCSDFGADIHQSLNDLSDLLRFDASMIASYKPSIERAKPLASTYDGEVTTYMTNAYLTKCPGFAAAKAQGVPLRMSDTPFCFYETDTYDQCLGPAGFREGLTYVLKDDRQQITSVLYLSSSHSTPLSQEGRSILLMLTPSLSSFVSQMGDESTVAHVVRIAEDDVKRISGAKDDAKGVLSREEMIRISVELCTSNHEVVQFYHVTQGRKWWRIVFRRKQSKAGERVLVEQRPGSPPMGLTGRETEVANLVCFGLTNAEIAEQLGVSLSTVKTYLEKLYCKLGVSRRSEVPMKVFQHGLYVQDFRIPVNFSSMQSVI